MSGDSAGVLYVAMGEEYVNEAIQSARSVKHVCDLPIAIATERTVDDPAIDQTLDIDDPTYGHSDKQPHLRRSPFERTLYLDSDIYATNDFADVFGLLDEFDIAAATDDTGWMAAEHGTSVRGGAPASFPEYNTGVLAYRSTDAVHDFFTQWERSHATDRKRHVPHDQPSFRRELYASECRIATLPRAYNVFLQQPGHLIGETKLIHGRLTDFEAGGANQGVPMAEAARTLTADSTSRLYVPQPARNTVAIIDPKPNYVLAGSKLPGVLWQFGHRARRDGAISAARDALAHLSDRFDR